MSAGRRSVGGRLGRVVGWVAIGLAALLVVAVVAVWLTLRSVGGRRAVFERVAAGVEEGTGWRVEVEDYSLRPARSTLTVEGLAAGAPGAPPVVEAERLEVVVGLWSLVRGPVVVRSLEVEGWRVDLARPLPAARPAPEQTAAEQPAPERAPLPVVRRLALSSGEVRGGPPPEAVAGRLAGWEVGGIELRGALADEALTLALERADVRLRRSDGEVIGLAATAALAGPVSGPWQLDAFELSGSGLEIEAHGTVAPPTRVAGAGQGAGVGPGRASGSQAGATGTVATGSTVPTAGRPGTDATELVAGRLAFSLNADVGGLFPDLAGSVSATGEADLAAGDLWLRLTAREVALDPLLAAAASVPRPGRAAPQDPGSAGPAAAAEDGSVPLPAGSLLAVQVEGGVRGWGSGLDLEAELSWTGADGSLARAKLAAQRAIEDEPLSATFDADLLPGLSGRRRLAGRLLLPAAADPVSAAGTLPAAGAEAGPLGLAPLEAGRLEDGRVEVLLPELAVARRQVEQIWPGLLATVPAPVLDLLDSPGGALSLDAGLEGALLDPGMTATASWRLPAGGGLAELRASGRPRSLSGEATATLRELDLAALEAATGIGLTGLVDARLEARGSPGDLRARLELTSAVIGAAAAPRAGPDEPGAVAAVEDHLAEAAAPTATGETSGSAPGALGAAVAFEPLVEDLRVVAELAGGRLRIDRLDGRAAGRSFSVRGDFEAALPLRRGDLQIELANLGGSAIEARAATEVRGAGVETAPAAPLQTARLELGLADGVVRVEIPHLVLAGAPPGRLRARLPWGSLTRLPGLGERFAGLPVAAPASGPLTAEWELPAADRAALLAALGLAPELQLRGGAAGEASYDPADPEAASGRLELRGLELVAGDRRVTAEGPLRLRVASGGLRLEPATLRLAGPEGEAGLDLQATLEPAARRGELVLVVAWPDGEVRALELRLELAEGIVRAAVPRVELEGSLAGLAAGARVTATLPLATLAGLPGLEVLGTLPLGLSDGAASGPLELVWELPETEWRPLLALLPGSGPLERLRVGGRGELRLDPRRPALGRGEIRLAALAAVVDGRPIETAGPLALELAEGRARLEPLALRVEGQQLRLAGHAELDPGWGPDAPPAALVRYLELDAHGTLPAELLNPFLAGGIGSGPLEVTVAVRGPPAELEGELRLDGSEAVVRYRAPYFVEIREPVLEALFAGGELRLEKGRLRLNEGEVQLDGRLAGGGGPDLTARLDGLRFRLDYGLLASIGGELRLELPVAGPGVAGGETAGPEGPPTARLSGRLVVERGSLTRPVRLEREALALLLAPVDLTGTEESPLEAIAVDLEVATGDGVRIRNNAADLWIRWEPLRVRGTLAVPLVEGRFEVEPGGRVHALGQTVRIDRGALELSGEEGVAPVLELETTSSLEDPSIARLAGDDPLLAGGEAAAGVPGALGVPGAVGAGLATYLAEQFTGRLSESLGIAGLTLRPVLVFGETDPSARLTLSQELSAGVALAASLDLRNAERQTYLLDVTEIGRLPRLRGQVFTSDQGSEGVTLQQRLELGGGDPGRRQEGPRLRRMLVEPPPGVSRRGLRRAIGVERGDALPDGGLFAIEVEAAAYLQRRGYPDARVEATLEPVSGPRGEGRGAHLVLAVDPGPRVRFRFEGPLPKSLRRSVSELYRADFFEAESLAEMRRQAERALRSRGFLDPEVGVEVTPGEGESAARTVLVRTSGGRRLKDPKLLLTGVPADEAARLAARFATPVQRLELAAALPEADARLLAALGAAGYPRAAIAARGLDDKGHVTVSIDPGPRQTLARVEVVGLDEAAEAERLAGVGGLEPGAPATAAGVAAAARAVEADLRGHGYDDVQVAARLEPLDDSGLELALVLEVEPGPRYRVAGSRVEGLRFTRPRWAARLAGLEEGSVLSPEELADARRRLYGTGLFRALTPTAEKDPAGEAAVVFRAEERSRFLLAYGLRWDSDEGGTAVVDLLDRNLLGRAVTLGLRALWSSDDRSLRLSAKLPYLVWRRGEIETLTSLREEVTEVDELETWVTSLQLSYPLAGRLTGRIYGRYREATLREKVSPDPFFPPVTRTFRNPFLGLQMLYDSRLGEGAGVRGLFASADLSGTGDFLGSDFEWLRFFGQFNLYRPAGRWGWRRLSWAQSVRVGLADSFGQVLDRPDRFFAGGDYSVRGYRTESLGPAEFFGAASRPRGGRALLVVNEELRFELLDRLSGLVFYDAGNVWTKTSDFGSDLFSAAGLGLRATTPVGLLRLDIAFPVDRRPEDSAFKLHFGFGNTF